MRRGAEADIIPVSWHGRDAVSKVRGRPRRTGIRILTAG